MHTHSPVKKKKAKLLMKMKCFLSFKKDEEETEGHTQREVNALWYLIV